MLKELVGGGKFQNLGYLSEIDYWKSKGGTGDTAVDCMVSYLATQGYSGTPKDQLIGWLQATQNKGTVGDNARALTGV
jgi:hypothetical protein